MTDTKLSEFSGSTKAHEMAKNQREISIAEFFEKNRHLLGFDNKRKALLTTIKEAVDNSLDACEEAQILPEISVEIIDMKEDRFRVIVEDNGPGIIKSQIPKIFGKLLYGSKFHRLKQSRGQQGIGISAAALYAQLTTGRPIKIISKIEESKPGQYIELMIDTQTNMPKIVKEASMDWEKKNGTRIELDIEATYLKGGQSVDEYLKQTAIVNPHITIIYTNPKAEQIIFPRATEVMPPEAQEIKPHPYGIELGMLIKMLTVTSTKTLQQFFTTEFSRVGPGTAKQICEIAAILPTSRPKSISREQAERLMKGIKGTKIIAPPTDCVVPIGAQLLEKGLKKEIPAEFYCSVTRPPNVYRGNPFIIEAAIAYGGSIPADKSINVMRFANRVPLLYQQGGCAVTKSIMTTAWRSYGLNQSQNSLPVGPAVVLVHFSSVWAPFTSEAKEALAHYPEIMKEIRLALQEAGRKLGKYVSKKKRVHDDLRKKSYIEKYLPYIGEALKELIGLDDKEADRTTESLKEILEKTRKIEEIEKHVHDKEKIEAFRRKLENESD